MQSTCDHIFVIRGERAKIYSVVKKIFLDNYEIAFTEKKNIYLWSQAKLYNKLCNRFHVKLVFKKT